MTSWVVSCISSNLGARAGLVLPDVSRNITTSQHRNVSFQGLQVLDWDLGGGVRGLRFGVSGRGDRIRLAEHSISSFSIPGPQSKNPRHWTRKPKRSEEVLALPVYFWGMSLKSGTVTVLSCVTDGHAAGYEGILGLESPESPSPNR